MNMVRASMVVLALAIGVPSITRGQPGESSSKQASSTTDGPPLTLREVLLVVAETHPELEAADQDVEAARGAALAAEGGWDPILRVRGRWSPVGYYDNGQVDAIVQQATPLWGAGLFAGYRLGWGDFPIYKGEQQTLSDGEFRAGVDVPILRDGPIDARRAQIDRTEFLTEAAECERQAKALKVALEASKAYWTWVAAGQEVRVQRDLLAVAQRRDVGLREQANQGSIPPIFVVDNERLVLDRESKLIASVRSFQEATLELSLFLRDSQRMPVRVSEDRVPEAMSYPDPPRIEDERDVDLALRARP
ncbi:MAG: TolC family protein, partial [Myxococcales bacterium]|nr:TolC family protein [Myxococcales bacterium]